MYNVGHIVTKYSFQEKMFVIIFVGEVENAEGRLQKGREVSGLGVHGVKFMENL